MLFSLFIFVNWQIIIERQTVSRCAMQGKYFDSSETPYFFFIVTQKIRMIFLPFTANCATYSPVSPSAKRESMKQVHFSM